MSDDKKKTPEQEAVEAVIKGTPVLQPGAGLPTPRLSEPWADQADTPLPLRSADYTPLTLTSVASATARASNPDQSEEVDAFVEALENLDDKKLALLHKGAMSPDQLGVGTDLKSEVCAELVAAVVGDREIARDEKQREAEHQRELEKVRIAAQGQDTGSPNSVFDQFATAYGLPTAIAGVVLLGVSLWLLGHFTAAPCNPVSVAWGMVEYTKIGPCAASADSEDSTDEATLTGLPRKVTDSAPAEVLEQTQVTAEPEPDSVNEPDVISVTDSERTYISNGIDDIWSNIAAENEWQKDANFDRDYVGKWIRIKGPAKLSGSAEDPSLVYKFEAADTIVKVFFRPEDADKLAPISDGAMITVDGKIVGRLFDLGLVVRDGEIVSYH